MNLNKAKVLVTGGSAGIGLATARLLLTRGALVAICGRDESKLKRAGKEIGAPSIHADVSREEDVARLVPEVVRQLGGYNVLINNAGFGVFAPLVELDVKSFDAVFGTNVRGAMLVARESARHFVKKQYGHIVNIASTAASRGYAGGTAYCASKFALTGMTQCWRAELRESNIRVMQVNPSEVLTEFASNAGLQQRSSERKLRPVEIAHTIASLLEMDDRGFITDVTVWATNPD